MKKLLVVILSLFLTLSLVGCLKPQPKCKEDICELPPIENPDDGLEEPKTPEEPIEEPIDEPIVDEPIETEDKEIVLDEELREQNVVHILELDVKDYNSFLLELYMTGSYDNPININYIKLDGVEVDFKTLKDIATKAGEHSTGEFEVVLGEGTIVLDIKRGTNYSAGFRIKSIGDEVGSLSFSLEGVEKLEISLVFTTSAAKYFENVRVSLKK